MAHYYPMGSTQSPMFPNGAPSTLQNRQRNLAPGTVLPTRIYRNTNPWIYNKNASRCPENQQLEYQISQQPNRPKQPCTT